VLARLGRLRLPSWRVSAVLVLAFFGFGVLLGQAAGSRVTYTAVASRHPVELVLPAASPTPGASEEAAEAPGEAPAAAEEATPQAPATEASPGASPSASTPAPAGDAGGHGKQGRPSPAPGAAAAKLPAIKHVFVLTLSEQPYAAVFGPESKAPYLARTLERRGELLPRYYAVAHRRLANGIALISGQGPTPATAADCPVYQALAPAGTGSLEQVAGEGCVYPPSTPTLPGQLEVKRLTWRAYVQGTDEAGAAAPACAHPPLGQPDPTATADAGSAPASTAAPASSSPYATSRNPFVYFEGLSASPSCAADDVGFAALGADLASAKRTPTLSYIVPDRCHDGSPGPCPGGGPGGLPAADETLRQLVPKILASPAYKQGGLLVITVDEAPSGGELADSSSCCGQPSFPNMPPPSGPAAALGPEGGGQVGALLLSPFVKAGSTSQEPYSHFSLLRTIEDLFALKHIGYAAAAKLAPLAPSLFSAKGGG
jgi:phosphatidylinositol-3-phosphatase